MFPHSIYHNQSKYNLCILNIYLSKSSYQNKLHNLRHICLISTFKIHLYVLLLFVFPTNSTNSL